MSSVILSLRNATYAILATLLVQSIPSEVFATLCSQVFKIDSQIETKNSADLTQLIIASGLQPELKNIQTRSRGLLTVEEFLKHRKTSTESGYLLGLTGGYRPTYQALAEATGLATWWRGFEERDLILGWENNGYFMDRAAAEDQQIYILIPDALTTAWAQSYSFAELRHALQNSNVLSHTTLVFGAHRLLEMGYEGGTPTRDDHPTSFNDIRQKIEAYTKTLTHVSVPANYGATHFSFTTSYARKIPLTAVPKELASYKGMRIENGILTQNFVQKAEDIYPPVLWSLNAPLAEGYVRAILSGPLSKREYAEKIHDV